MNRSEAEILREYGPFPGIDHVHGVTFDGEHVWFASGDKLNALDPASGRRDTEIGWRFRVGDVVKLRLVSDRQAFHGMQHPIHVHGQRFLVAALNGVPVENHAWKDTVLVPAGGAVDVLIELSNPGDWMVHCHIAEHLESGMQTVFRVE